jgi:hypothetical protein
MTVTRWTMVQAQYPAASFEIGPEDLHILFNALQDHQRYYVNREEAGGLPREESVRIKAMLHTLDDLRRELDMQMIRPETVKTIRALP